ncbi:MAG: hypothetical protein L0Y72_23260 [Gemmataceae bacterium]|nr:hypothetical protein [Gemmataceae bacterium]MCI0741963.1 hypothetical protein [Gemmataceae bacterium]
MTLWRWALAVGLILLIALPLVRPFADAGDALTADWSADDAPRLAQLFLHTSLLVVGVSASALPLGVFLAVLLVRTDLTLRRVFLGAVLVYLFLPVPLQVSAWQAIFGNDGLLPLWWWGNAPGRAWTAGLIPAVWVHACAGLPWVVLIVGAGLRNVERELEEDALLSHSYSWALWHVTLPRCRGSILAAALWLALYTAADVSVTDMFLVPTFAEEIHTRFTLGGGTGLAQALILSVPYLVGVLGLLFWLVPSFSKHIPSLQLSFAEPARFPLRRRALWFTVASFLCVIVFVLPLFGLLWKLGFAGRAWSLGHAAQQFASVVRLYGLDVLLHICVAALTAFVTVALAWLAARLAQSSPIFGILLLALCGLALATPAPVAGIGLKETIFDLVQRWFGTASPAEASEPGLWARLLYNGPSPLPLIWAHCIRFFPVALAIVWPAVRLVPQELRDLVRLERCGLWTELRHVLWPYTARAFCAAVAVVVALSLGEIGASARVETPGWENFAKLIFDRMHYGIDANVAALSLLLLGEILVLLAVGNSLWKVVVSKFRSVRV